MSIFELRGEITTMISQMDDKNLLLLLRNQVAKALKGEIEQPDSDWWDELPVEQQERILRIQAQMRRGENVVSHEEALKQLNLESHASQMVG
jgi:hypothetical protein